ncbi:uracil-DNA glycosylase [Salibacterium halotolerans]|uniref:Uracil-DNA glycosylase n=1 Tax=Salibacterium halotolerans TaxID=1884432 RepID=A0A1I5U2B4_9BACI|nr:uracil-DNA glycosylase [Salibacterium halotolerans]SFP89424.1 uracil-DNA glycosylase [Salibacterium halotolerans]
MSVLKNDWADVLDHEFKKDYYLQLREFLKQEYGEKTIYPDMYDIFNALHHTPYERTKAVILGQDPYHGPNQAHGLSFSVQSEVKMPPSLQNIYKEMQEDIGCPVPSHGCLTSWAEQGVLLLNTVLTVRAGQAASHRGAGWEHFTNEVINQVNNKSDPVVFILWGRHAQAKEELVNADRHLVIKSPHPSPFSAHKGFFGSRPFSRTNEFLREMGRPEIDWCIPDQ